MATISERLAHTTVVYDDDPRVVIPNPVRRGPVVLATDGSSSSGAPVIIAQQIASQLGLDVEVVTVLPVVPTFVATPDVVMAMDDAADADARRDARETTVRDYVGRFSGGATPARIHVRFGAVATAIAQFAREVSATIVVMGSAPHRLFHHVVSGKRAARVLHMVECPVLSVPPTIDALPRTVVAAVDFGPSSIRAVQAALLMVGRGCRVILTHVIPPPVRPAVLNLVSPDDLAVDTHALLHALAEDVESYVPDGVSLETRIVSDEYADGILSAANTERAGLISMGTHGPNAISRVVLGSVAESVLCAARQCVLISPPVISARYSDQTARAFTR